MYLTATPARNTTIPIHKKVVDMIFYLSPMAIPKPVMMNPTAIVMPHVTMQYF